MSRVLSHESLVGDWGMKWGAWGTSISRLCPRLFWQLLWYWFKINVMRLFPDNSLTLISLRILLWNISGWNKHNSSQASKRMGCGPLVLAGSSLSQCRRQWHPTPVLLPGESHGWRSLVGCIPRGREESDMTERLYFHFHALEKEMATHSSVLAWRIPGTGEPGELPSMGSHRVGHDWGDLAAAAAVCPSK